MIIARVLALAPAVERLIHHQHSQPVAGIQEGRRGWVMRAPDGVVPAGLVQRHLALLRPWVGSRAHHAVIVVYAAAPHLNRLPVEQKALFSAPCDAADAKNGCFRIHSLSPIITLVSSRYRLGVSGDHSCGLATCRVRVKSWVAPASIVACTSIADHTLLSGPWISEETAMLWGFPLSFTTRVCTRTAAFSLEISGVVTDTPQCATCTGSAIYSQAGR